MSESANSAISATFLIGFEILLWLGWLSDDSRSDGDGLAVLLDDVSFLALDLLGENDLLISLLEQLFHLSILNFLLFLLDGLNNWNKFRWLLIVIVILLLSIFKVLDEIVHTVAVFWIDSVWDEDLWTIISISEVNGIGNLDTSHGQGVWYKLSWLILFLQDNWLIILLNMICILNLVADVMHVNSQLLGGVWE